MRTPLPLGLALLLLGACGSSSGAGGAPPGHDAGSPDSPDVGTPEAGGDAAPGKDSGREASPGKDGALGDSGAILGAPEDTWTWIPLSGMRCGNGSETGIGLNPHAGATHLLLFLQGGGACSDATTCWGAFPTASNMNGYGAKDFAADPTLSGSIFQRTDAANPFGDATMVFVPYCTGDIHVGTGTATYTVAGKPTLTYFSGATNVDAVVASLAASYKGLSRVFLTGISAGGFGTFLNQDAVTRGMGVPVDVIDDSGPAIAGAVPSDWVARIPPGCVGCADAPSIFAYTRKTYPDTRYGFLTFQTDTVLPEFFGESEAAFAKTIATFVSSLAPDPNAKAFVDQSSGHVVLAGTDPKAVPYILPWLSQIVTADPSWANAAH